MFSLAIDNLGIIEGLKLLYYGKCTRVLYLHKLDVGLSTGIECCRFDAHALFKSLKSSLSTFTASSNAHDAPSSIVDCASTTNDVSTRPATAKITERQNDSDMPPAVRTLRINPQPQLVRQKLYSCSRKAIRSMHLAYAEECGNSVFLRFLNTLCSQKQDI